MQSIKGTQWGPSDGESSTINGWLNFVGTSFPEMADYCTGETHIGYFSWCGCTVGYCIAKAGIRPVYTRGLDTKSFLWAQAWLDWGTPVTDPQPGDVLVFDFGHGDHHVTLFDHDNGNGTWGCLGGNQDHQVMISNFRRSQCIGIRRPPAAGAVQTPTSTSIRPEVKLDDVGSVVSELQHLLGVTVDGEFGPETDAAVRAYQATHGLDVDGEVGDETWAALLSGKPATALGAAISADTVNKIVQLAAASDLARYSWGGRGAAPPGYIKGMAVAYANVYAKWKKGDSAAAVMAAPNSGDSSRDAFAWYDAHFAALGLGNGPDEAKTGDTLRHLFVLLDRARHARVERAVLRGARSLRLQHHGRHRGSRPVPAELEFALREPRTAEAVCGILRQSAGLLRDLFRRRHAPRRRSRRLRKRRRRRLPGAVQILPRIRGRGARRSACAPSGRTGVRSTARRRSFVPRPTACSVQVQDIVDAAVVVSTAPTTTALRPNPCSPKSSNASENWRKS